MSGEPDYDVIVIGGGNAGMTAALTARESGARVLVVEAAPEHARGGNSRHVRNLRCMHDEPLGVLQDSYTESEYWEDLQQVTGGRTNEDLARLTIKESEACFRWMVQQGVRFQPALGGTLQLSRTNAFFLGGGKALLNGYYRKAADIGIEVIYDSPVSAINIDDGKFSSVVIQSNGQAVEIQANALVVAAGGFQANIDWLREIWGPAADNFIIRGSPFDDGKVLRLLMDADATITGDPDQCHAIAVDARAPKFDAGIVSRVDCVSLGIVVNQEAKRFYDEGEDFWPKRYAIWGRLIADQPEQIAYAIIDNKSSGLYLPPLTPPVTGGSVTELANALSLDAATLEQTISSFNSAIETGDFDHSVLDNCHTNGLTPNKSHWARTIDTPPFMAYPLRPGITFTYMGVVVNEQAKVTFNDNKLSPNIYAAGEIMAGNILGKGYLAGLGMTIGTTFGRISGREAARHAR
ncbi:MAG: FAD-dependent tricarballylate dehydrogenase TcuA [Gammaproteobacteria bacterium]|nr:FAD-dependent tricarballylate dehydrogenase TcuA [Gammaproteobacteria bacterium]